MTLKLWDKLVKIQYGQKTKTKMGTELKTASLKLGGACCPLRLFCASKCYTNTRPLPFTSQYEKCQSWLGESGKIMTYEHVQALKKSVYFPCSWTPTNSSLNQKADSSELLAEDSVNSRYLPRQVFKSEMWWSTFRSIHCDNFNAQQVRKLRMSYGQFTPDVGVCWHTPSRNVEYFWGLLAGVL